MPYKDPKDRNFKKEYQRQLARGEGAARKLRQQARAAYDAKGIDRKNRDIDHSTPISLGGGNKGNLRLTTPKANRSFARQSNHKPKVTK